MPSCGRCAPGWSRARGSRSCAAAGAPRSTRWPMPRTTRAMRASSSMRASRSAAATTSPPSRARRRTWTSASAPSGRTSCPRDEARLEPELLRLDDVGDAADALEKRVGERLIDLDEAQGVGAGARAAEMEGRDVDPGLAQRAAQIADEARLVLVPHEQHVRPELRLHRDVLDADDARPVAAEERAGDAARALVGPDRQA